VRGTCRFALSLLLLGLGATAQVRLPELDFPSANGKHEQPIKVKAIRGIVVDENDAVIPNAQVEIRRVNGDKVVEVAKSATDSVGRFQYDATKGNYQLNIRARGFRQETVPLEISKKGWPGFKVLLTVGRDINVIEVPRPAPN
jgi:Carboxypeptidase regulatory-like domain